MESKELLEGVNEEEFAAFRERISLGSGAAVVAPQPATDGPSPIELLREQAEEDDVDAILRLAQALQDGDGVDPDPAAALDLLERADALSAPEATLAYAIALVDTGSTQDKKLAGFERLIRLASGTDAIALDGKKRIASGCVRSSEGATPPRSTRGSFTKKV
jgi:hypothetical protein